MYHTETPTDKTIREWYMKFQQSGCLCAVKRRGCPGPSAETVECVRETFVRSLQKSTDHVSWELQAGQKLGEILYLLILLLSAVSVLVVAQLSSEIPEGLMNNPVYVKYAF